MMKLLVNGDTLTRLHETVFTVSALIASHKASYEQTLGVIFSGLLHTTARLMIETKAMREPRRAAPKVIKHALKVKVEKPTITKNISASHVK
eukprot:7875550-Heterocapsa_arctica.AAC.1